MSSAAGLEEVVEGLGCCTTFSSILHFRSPFNTSITEMPAKSISTQKPSTHIFLTPTAPFILPSRA
ncbi:ORF5 [White spot syndrome virus]|uniref:Wsv424 n=3 Tax=White spot syndrome virus TaxID=342409 RepID=Q8VAI8_WSSVS|nr:wsv424 [Shrimp white spot syndrome virus]AFX59801.1 wsv424 [White spot syndrome virus]AAL33426.1 wsv424 [Shrimp white spot syndrome virus]AAL89351.1 WSSV483 [Shrimp white spot syndrome virus]ATU84083.1 ORF5 [White spot syndrome virus]AWQ60548.1 wsv424 [Shrimp white spot syndrome virus]